MPLPRQQGPFAVGAIDLEVPVREPRSFATDIVDPSRINRPSSKSRKSRTTAGGSSKRASSSRERAQQGDLRSASEDAQNEGNDGLPQWSPLAHGSKTSTLHLSTVLFTVYYPCAGDGKDLDDNYRRTAWLGRPKRKGVKALFSYLSQYGIAGPFAAVPASPAVATLLAAKMCVWAGPALADPQDPRARAPPPQNRPTVGLFGHEPASFPVIVFSHGLAGSRLAYSQYCSELASQGIVVAAIEHRDGSGIASVVRPPIYPQLARKDQSAENAQQSKHSSKPWKRGHPKAAVPYFTFEAVGLRSFPTDPSEREVGMRQAQLAMRCAEIEECLHVLKRIADGDGAAVAKESTRSLTSKLGGRPHTRKGLPGSLLEDESNLKCWAGKIDVDYPALAGHSFGGATALELLRGPDPPFPFAMILDPWVEPLIIDDSEPRPLRAPVYVMNSESFTLWGSHFEKVKRLAGDAQHANRENRGWLMTLAGSEHLSFSDYPLLLPRIFRTTISPRSAIEIYTRATLVQVGLLRQRYRERADQPGIKFGDSRALEKEQSKDETLGVRQEGKGVTGNERTMSPEPIRNDERRERLSTQDATPPPAGEEGEGGVNQSTWQRFARSERTHAETEMEQAVESGQDPIRAVADDGEDKSVHPDPEAGDDHPSTKARRQGEAVAHHSSTHEHLKGVVAFRTDSGGMASRPRRTDDYKDLVKDPARIKDEELKHDLDHDVEVVHASLKDLSESQKHKKYRTRSLAGLMYRSMGLRPSLSTPGAVLIHDLRRQEGMANEEGNEGDSGASTMI